MTSRKAKRSSPKPKKKGDVELVLGRPRDDSDEALREFAKELTAALQEMRRRKLAEIGKVPEEDLE